MIRMVVYGMPGPQGSKKAVGRDGKGRAILVESSAKVKPWREDVRAAALAELSTALVMRDAADGKLYRGVHQGDRFFPFPLDQPLRVRMVFTIPKPAGAPKRRTTWPDRMPDLSKLVRSTEDALTSAGLWKDDARVVELTTAKRYPMEGSDALAAPGAVIEVEVIR